MYGNKLILSIWFELGVKWIGTFKIKIKNIDII
jgi:hypothetical protein